MDSPVYHTTAKSKYHEKNEDSCFIGDGFVVVADGMGGESCGDIASKIAVETTARMLADACEEAAGGDMELLFSAVYAADRNISVYADEHPESMGMGTTMLIMTHKNRHISLAWCGDSRAYVYRDGRLHSLTKDHSYVQQLIDDGKISVDESFTHPDNNLITRFVGGGEETCIPEYTTCEADDSDIIILCSDGLSGYCRDKDIEREIATNQDLSTLPARLKELAARHGSDDDITIVVLSAGGRNAGHRHFALFDWFRKV